MKITVTTLQNLKQKKEPIVMLTSYDASLAKVSMEAGIEILLVGDSLGNAVQGHNTTISVTMDDMIYHTRCVSRVASDAFIIADLPFMSYASVEKAFCNATQLMQAGAMMVKMEGGAWLIKTIKKLVERGIPVCAHLGLIPQSVYKLGGFKKQAKDPESQQQLLHDAKALEKAGAQLLVLECVPELLAAQVQEELNIPVIGIGAGKETDGQVMVVYDILGLSGYIPSFAKDFLCETNSIKSAIMNYLKAVKERKFPL